MVNMAIYCCQFSTKIAVNRQLSARLWLRLRLRFPLQCSDSVGRATGRASSLLNVESWFVGGDDLTGALHVLHLQSVVTAHPPVILAPIKSRMETF